MKKLRFLVVVWIGLFSAFCGGSHSPNPEPPRIMDARDREIAEKILDQLRHEEDLPTGERVIRVASLFMDVPYAAHTLEKGPEEHMVINLREMDCTTFAENCLALARTLQMKKPGFEEFVLQLEKIRYRDGIRQGYLSRLHYFSDWIYNNGEKGIVRDVSQEIAHTLVPNRVHFMSSNQALYSALDASPWLTDSLRRIESGISGRMAWYIPKNRIAACEGLLKDGDIAGIRTNMEGLDVSHVVILWKVGGRFRFIHASSREGKVLLSDETLEEYLKKSKSATGIMVARPL